jgi:hypothetical protein
VITDPSEVTRAESKTARVMRELQALERRLRRASIAIALVAIVELLIAAFTLRLWMTR